MFLKKSKSLFGNRYKLEIEVAQRLKGRRICFLERDT
jgi:hypothetical protein